MKSAVAAEASRDQAAVIAVCCAAISGLSALAIKHRSELLQLCPLVIRHVVAVQAAIAGTLCK